jgi:oligopeptide transport system ATP-binding protein
MANVKEISKRFSSELDEIRAVKHVSFDVPDGHLITLLGAGGCRKTTIPRCIARLERSGAGSVSIDWQTIFSATNHFLSHLRIDWLYGFQS